MKPSRREFLQSSAVASSALVATSSSLAQEAAEPESTGLRLAAIGVGGSRGAYSRGGTVARQAARHANMIAVCDVDDRHTAEFNERFDGKLNTYRDYRELLEKEKPDVVTIGTPDHWHVEIAIAALRSGADVYCEKPLTLTIDQGKQIRKVVEETGKVFQVGTQQRTEFNQVFLRAIAMVHSGRVGDNVNAFIAIEGAPSEATRRDGPFEASTPPDDLDWDMWLGAAPKKGFSRQRRRRFRWYFEYSGGKITDWGAHHIDIAQWALAPGEDGPVKITSTGGKFPSRVPEGFDWNAFLEGEGEETLPDGYNTATEFHVNLAYDSGANISVNHHYSREGDNVDFGNGILFEGSKGRIFVNRGRLSGSPVDALTDADNAELDELITKLCKGKQPGNHMANFFECIEDRGTPISDVWTHHRTMTSCHLCNIALMLGRDLQWDPKAEVFVDDDEANKFLARKTYPVPAPEEVVG